MRKETFHTVCRLVEDAPRTEQQAKTISGDLTRSLIDCAAAEILGVSVITMRRRLALPLRQG